MKKVHYNKGFTLVEMIVSLGIFTIVALIAVTALLKIMDANKKSIALKTAINNMNFTLESMSREMRLGKNYSCGSVVGGTNNNLTPSGCDTTSSKGNWTIAFNSSKRDGTPGTCNLIYAYRYTAPVGTNPAKLEKAQQTVCGTAISPLTDFKDLISSEIKINTSIITVNNSGQPYVTIFFKGISGVKAREQAEFTVQTAISQRLPK